MNPSVTPTTSDVISCVKLDRTAVCNSAGHELNFIDDLIADRLSGPVRDAVLEFDGFAGVRADRYLIFWIRLKYDTALAGFTVPLGKVKLPRAPKYAQNTRSNPVMEHITPEPTHDPETPAPAPPAPPGPDLVPPKIDEPTPIEIPAPVREPHAPPPPKVANAKASADQRRVLRFAAVDPKTAATLALCALFAVASAAQTTQPPTPGPIPNESPVGTPTEPAEIIGRPVMPPTSSATGKAQVVGGPKSSSQRSMPQMPRPKSKPKPLPKHEAVK